jgi:hypothetical protein
VQHGLVVHRMANQVGQMPFFFFFFFARQSTPEFMDSLVPWSRC